MKLLLDENLAPRLAAAISDVFPGSVHARDVGLASASDESLWDYAAANGFIVASKDSDFHQRSFVFGAPPKVIWLRLGNCRTDDIERLLRRRSEEIRQFAEDRVATFLALS